MFFQINAISNNSSELISGNSRGISIISNGAEEFDQQATLIVAAPAEKERKSKSETDDDRLID